MAAAVLTAIVGWKLRAKEQGETDADADQAEFLISPDAKITLNGKPVKIAQLEPGDLIVIGGGKKGEFFQVTAERPEGTVPRQALSRPVPRRVDKDGKPLDPLNTPPAALARLQGRKEPEDPAKAGKSVKPGNTEEDRGKTVFQEKREKEQEKRLEELDTKSEDTLSEDVSDSEVSETATTTPTGGSGEDGDQNDGSGEPDGEAQTGNAIKGDVSEGGSGHDGHGGVKTEHSAANIGRGRGRPKK